MKRFSALFLLIVLIPLVCTAEDAEKQIRAGIENVMDGLDFDQAADIALNTAVWKRRCAPLQAEKAFRQTTR